MINRYVGYTKTELEVRLRRANDALDRGNQTVAGLEPGVRHEFAEKSDEELRQIITEILTALNLIDPTTYPASSVQKRMKICTTYGC